MTETFTCSKCDRVYVVSQATCDHYQQKLISKLRFELEMKTSVVMVDLFRQNKRMWKMIEISKSLWIDRKKEYPHGIMSNHWLRDFKELEKEME